MTAYTASDIAIPLKRVFQLPRLQVIVEDAVVRSYPKRIINPVVRQSADIVSLSGHLGRHHHVVHLRPSLTNYLSPLTFHLYPVQSPAPCAYPQSAMGIWFQHRYRVMFQSDVRQWPVVETVSCLLTPDSCLPSIQSAFHRTYPQRTVGFHIHGINGVRRQRTGIAWLVAVVTQHQRLGRQFDDTCRLSTNPYLSVAYHQAVYEVARHGVSVRCRVPVFEAAVLFIEDVHTA